MRVISGKHRGFVFPSHKLAQTRPTTDRAKESLFNIIHHQMSLEGASVLDLYSGTGNLGFECLSRGASKVVMVEQNFKAVSYIKKVAAVLKEDPKVIRSRVLPLLPKLNASFDLIIADPPYDSHDYGSLVQEIQQSGLLAPGGLLVIEHASMLQLNAKWLKDRRQYGQSTFSFFTFE